MKTYNKLVHDNISKIMLTKGLNLLTRFLSSKKYNMQLNKELLKVVNAKVVQAILKYNNITYQEFDSIRQKEAELKGAFDRKIFLEKEIT